MRELKFRAWDKEYGWMIEDYCVIAEDGIVETKGGIRTDEAILMQYTGLKDKNGKEIYEGDIVIFNNYIGEIKYYTGNVGGGSFRIEPNGDRHFYDEMGSCFSWNEVEIVGNIKENPELLEKK